MDAVIWCGPVSTSNIAGIAWRRPTKIITVSGNGSSHFANVAAGTEEEIESAVSGLGALPLSALLDQHGVPDAERVALMGFSAGHGLIEGILRSPDMERVNALGAFDAYFVGHGQGPKPGYLRFCQRAASGDALAVVTTSSREATSGLNQPPSGPRADLAFGELAAEVGVVSISPPAGVPVPSTTQGAGLFVWANYLEEFGHEGHATQLATIWGNALIAPYMAGDAVPLKGGSRKRRIAKYLIAGAAVVVAGLVAHHAATR
jgi:hypothetical protein